MFSRGDEDVGGSTVLVCFARKDILLSALILLPSIRNNVHRISLGGGLVRESITSHRTSHSSPGRCPRCAVVVVDSALINLSRLSITKHNLEDFLVHDNEL